MEILIRPHKILSGILKWIAFRTLQTPLSFTRYQFIVVQVVIVEAIALAQVVLWAVPLVGFWHQQSEQQPGMVNMLRGLRGGYMKRGAKWERAGFIFQKTARNIPLRMEKSDGVVLVVSIYFSFHSLVLEFLFDLSSFFVVELHDWYIYYRSIQGCCDYICWCFNKKYDSAFAWST